MRATTLADRAVIRLSGDDVRGFVQGLVTSDVAGELPVWAGLLTPQGKCLFDFMLWGDADDLLLDCEAVAADGLIKRLSVYRLRRPIRIERDPALAVHWSANGGGGVDDPRLPELGRRWIGEPKEAASGWLEHRLRLGVCEGRAELGDLLWLECNAAELNGVSFTKGCFVGQENTARMNWRAKVNRRLVVLRADTPGPRTRVHYPDIGLAVEHRRTDDLGGAIIPDWLAPALPPLAAQAPEQ
ncbi:MAG: folate-binding protein YgfZ [Sphingomonas sp.]|nr:folate-binding protein YgfZ [Sphingomonas sp.]